jgi:two-component system OmpR family sensor kinase/two-component system sensor histidine kinase BaeS
MNRLWVRLTLAFLLVTLFTVAIVAGVAAWSAGRQFRGYLSRPDVFARDGRLDALEVHYQQYGTWDGVAEALAAFQPRHPPASGSDRPPPGPDNPARRGPPILVADAQGRVVYGSRRVPSGTPLKADDLARAQPINVNDALVGYVLAEPADFDFVGPSERNFLDQLQRSIVIAAMGAAGLGVGLGLVVSRSLAKPLATLAQTAHAFAARDWTQRVPLKETSRIAELGEVSLAFNNMADSLQESETLRRNLMADVAHELRTPLTVIQGLLRALLDGVHPLQLKEIAVIYDETRLLSRLVEDVRELALAEAHQLPLVVQAMDVGTLLRATADRFAAAADVQDVTLQLDAPGSLPHVQADPHRAAQVLQNLVGNALRHSSAGGTITLAAQARKTDVQVSVSDTGEGIPIEDLPHVFDRFYRGDTPHARSGGSGLGLTIAKTLVEMMGGAIGVESAPGAGSRFWFTLPTTTTKTAK